MEDVLPESLVSFRVLQRRFSRRSFLRQTREHRHALQILRTYIGENPPPRYQPSLSRRSCLVIGREEDADDDRDSLFASIDARGYEPMELPPPRALPGAKTYEVVASADVALCFIDTDSVSSHFLMGLAQASFLPTIAFTADPEYPFDANVPIEYQPRQVDGLQAAEVAEPAIARELELYEQDFLELADQEKVDRYARLLINLGSLRGSLRRHPAWRDYGGCYGR